MDRNFERVYEAVTVLAPLPITRDLLTHSGYHKPDTELNSDQRQRLFHYSVWKRFGLDLISNKYSEILGGSLFACYALDQLNLIPHLSHTLNCLLPEDYEHLETSQVVTSKLSDHLDSYLVWKGEFGLRLLQWTLESAVLQEKLRIAGSRPGGEETFHDWAYLHVGVPDNELDPEL